MKATHLLTSLACLGLLISPAAATHCVIRSSSYVAPVKKVVAVKAHAYAYPYAATYDDSYERGYAQGVKEGELKAKVQYLEDRVRRLEGGDAQPRPPEPPPPPMGGEAEAPLTQAQQGFLIVRTTCAKCHDPSQGAVKGGVLLTHGGEAADYSCKLLLKVQKQVYEGHMPPGGGLTPEQKGAVMAWAATQTPSD